MTSLEEEHIAVWTRAHAWLNGPYDDETKREVLEMIEHHPAELIEAFCQDLCFGTGGLRGVMGPGTARMNVYTVRMATQGLANYLLKNTGCEQTPTVCIGFDSRIHSDTFAQETAKVLVANGIKVYLLTELRPVPFVSFCCRYLRCSAAVMITASHNPREYNGYKVYWSDGAQVISPHDVGIMTEMSKICDLSQVQVGTLDHPLIYMARDQWDQEYLDAIRHLQICPKENTRDGHTLSIVYSSLHGTGITLVPQALRDWGFSKIEIVVDQSTPDGRFPTVETPNPEYHEALQMGIAHLQTCQGDIFFATDPDADRLAVVVRHRGLQKLLTGNEIASICVHYLCEQKTRRGVLTHRAAFVTTIVSTDLVCRIAEIWHVNCFRVLTGFKYIAEKIREWERTPGSYEFIFGAEESYGSLLGTTVRDKDAVVSCCLVAEIALWAKQQRMTLIDVLSNIYRKYGLFREGQRSVSFPLGKAGHDEMSALMDSLRAHPPKVLCGQPIEVIEDYLVSTRTIVCEGRTESLTLPQSDVVLFRLADQSRLVIRPSGTEPKLKIYGSVRSHVQGDLDTQIAREDAHLIALLDTMEQILR